MKIRALMISIPLLGLTGFLVRWWWKYQRLTPRARRKLAPGNGRWETYIRNPWTFLLLAFTCVAMIAVMWAKSL